MMTRYDESAKKALSVVEALQILREAGYEIEGNHVGLASMPKQRSTMAKEMLGVLQEAGYTVTPPQQTHTTEAPRRPKSYFDEQYDKWRSDPAQQEAYLDRSRPRPEWMRGQEERLLKKFEIELLGIMDAQHPFGR
jgi:hypothetical protein